MIRHFAVAMRDTDVARQHDIWFLSNTVIRLATEMEIANDEGSIFERLLALGLVPLHVGASIFEDGSQLLTDGYTVYHITTGDSLTRARYRLPGIAYTTAEGETIGDGTENELLACTTTTSDGQEVATTQSVLNECRTIAELRRAAVAATHRSRDARDDEWGGMPNRVETFTSLLMGRSEAALALRALTTRVYSKVYPPIRVLSRLPEPERQAVPERLPLPIGTPIRRSSDGEVRRESSVPPADGSRNDASENESGQSQAAEAMSG